jgi:C4-dicarboxylate transporter DctQ subunit
MNNQTHFISKVYQPFYTFINKFEAFLLVVSVLLMASNNIANVIGRVVFQESLFFTEELNSILIVLITFAGSSYASRHARHIKMTALFDLMSPVYKKIILIIISLVTAVVMWMMCYFSVEYINWIAPKGKVLPATQIPVYLTYLWVPASLFLTGLEYLLTATKNITHHELYLSSSIKVDIND